MDFLTKDYIYMRDVNKHDYAQNWSRFGRCRRPGDLQHERRRSGHYNDRRGKSGEDEERGRERERDWQCDVDSARYRGCDSDRDRVLIVVLPVVALYSSSDR
jgi:hypothetical protein